jgi:hypothetical protein
MHEDELIVSSGEIDVLFQHLQLVAGVFVQPDFADAEHIGAIEKLRDQGDHVLRQLYVLRFLRIDAQPGEMREKELGGALRLVIRELAKVIVKTLRPAAVVSGPKGRLANGAAAGGDHRLVVVRHPADHVSVGFDVAHS